MVVAFLFSSLQQPAFAQQDYGSFFNKAYQQFPDLPKGTLEAVAYSNTRMHHITHHAGSPESCTGMPKAYGVMGLVLDGKNYFRNNLVLVSNLSGIKADEIMDSPEKNILAYAAAFDAVLRNKFSSAKNVDAIGGALALLSELPHDDEGQTFALHLQLYSYLTFLNDTIFQEQYDFPNYNLDLHSFFGEENFKVLTAPYVIVSEEEIYDINGNVYDGGNARGRMSADYPPALWNAAASCNYSTSRGAAISAVVIHDVEGSYAGCISWFKNCSSGVSAHYVIRSSDGQITQMVLEQHRAWHVGSHNTYTIGIEHEGYQAQQGWYTTAMYTASANLVKDICSSGYGISPTTCYNGPSCNGICTLSTSYKIKGHQHYSGQTHNDPGPNWNWYTYYSLINNTTQPTPPANDNCSAAASLTANTSCVTISGTLLNATTSGLVKATCDVSSSSSLKDVWYKFTATATTHTVTLTPSSGLDGVLALYTSCTSGQIGCSDNGGGRGGVETIVKSGLTVGTTYYIRIYPYGSTAPSTWTFNVCVTRPATTNTLTIGNGTSAYSAHPYSTVYMDERTEYIITKSELVSAGWTTSTPNIVSLAFQVNSAAAQSMNGFTISIAQTTSSIFSSTTFLTGANSTTVYSGTVTATTGWNTYNFSAPFVYNGTDNLLIKICWNNSSYTSNSSILATSYSNYVALYYRADVANGSVCSQATGTRSYYRPNAKLTFSSTTSSTQPNPNPNGKEPDVTGINDNSSEKSFTVYPNPFDGKNLFGKISEPNGSIMVQLFDVSGKELFSQTVSVADEGFAISFPENQLQTGMYLITGIINERRYVTRVMVR